MDYKRYNDYEVVYRIRENDEEAVNIIFKKYEPVIRSFVNKYYDYAKKYGVDIYDLMQEGRIALNGALSSYQDSCGVKFYTYASVCINRHLISYCRNVSNVKHSVLNYSVGEEGIYLVGDSTADPQVLFSEKGEIESFINYKNLFNFNDGNIFELRCNGFSYKEIGKLLDIPTWRVDARLRSIRKKILSSSVNKISHY